MKTHVITATQMSQSLSDVFNKVYYQGDSFEIKRGREIIAKIIPIRTKKPGLKVSELPQFFASLPHMDKEESAAFMQDLHTIRKQKTRNPWT